MKILYSHQVKDADAYTIEHEPILSINLMERAATKLAQWIFTHFGEKKEYAIFVGPGNNGGDGLACARLLWQKGCKVNVFEVNFTNKRSQDFQINYERLKKLEVPVYKINSKNDFPELYGGTVIVDAIFGSGLSRPVEGLAAEVIRRINSSKLDVVAVDIPSGLFGENNRNNNYNHIVRANYTLTFQYPNLSFLLPENQEYVGDWIVLDIGILQEYIDKVKADYYLFEKTDAQKTLRPRKNFDHKGTFGHGLLIAGSKGKMGAAILASMATLRSGIGLFTAHIPSSGYKIFQTALPEAMLQLDENKNIITTVEINEKITALGVGPGIGINKETVKVIEQILEMKIPTVIDADGLNLLSQNRYLLGNLHKDIILTPHPKEFERLVGKEAKTGYDRLMMLREFAFDKNVVVVLKGHYSAIAIPEEEMVYFNTTGNPGMATGGSGDVLTGIVLGLLAQKYSVRDAALLGVYLHGLAGDKALLKESQESLIASDIVKHLGTAFKELH